MAYQRSARQLAAAQLLVVLATPLYVGAQSPAPPHTAFLIRADLFSATNHHWRGIRRSDAPVLHADVASGARLGQFSLTVGGWTGLELREADGRGHSDLRPGHWGFAEWDLWGQAAARFGPATGSFGFLRSTYLRRTPHPSVTEAYGSVRVQLNRVAASLVAWHAIRGAHGVYLEPALAFHHFINPLTGPAVTWTTTAVAGFQIGHRRPHPGVPGASGTGLTHGALSTSLRLAVNLGPAALVMSMSPVLQVSRDPSTFIDGHDVRFWWPLQAGISWPFRRPE